MSDLLSLYDIKCQINCLKRHIYILMSKIFNKSDIYGL